MRPGLVFKSSKPSLCLLSSVPRSSASVDNNADEYAKNQEDT